MQILTAGHEDPDAREGDGAYGVARVRREVLLRQRDAAEVQLVRQRAHVARDAPRLVVRVQLLKGRKGREGKEEVLGVVLRKGISYSYMLSQAVVWPEPGFPKIQKNKSLFVNILFREYRSSFCSTSDFI